MNASQSARLRPFKPLKFGRYTLLAQLAVGGMGEVYLARLEGPRRFEKLCVIKRILPNVSNEREFLERFVNEARTLVKLQHGSIAQVLDVGLHEGDPFIALEYVDGKDLRKVLARSREQKEATPLSVSLYIMGRVLDALAYAHRKRDEDDRELNLVHRDISPQNILVSYEGEVKVIDFGLAKSTLSSANTNPTIIMGKFLYMSPEQVQHLRVDRRTDLYSVGLCLYELIAGVSPFQGVATGDLMNRLAHPEFAPLDRVAPNCSSAISRLVMQALLEDPDHRFQSAEEFRGRLLAARLELDPSAGPEAVSDFMRKLFEQEARAERRLLATFKEPEPSAERLENPPTLRQLVTPSRGEVERAPPIGLTTTDPALARLLPRRDTPTDELVTELDVQVYRDGPDFPPRLTQPLPYHVPTVVEPPTATTGRVQTLRFLAASALHRGAAQARSAGQALRPALERWGRRSRHELHTRWFLAQRWRLRMARRLRARVAWGLAEPWARRWLAAGVALVAFASVVAPIALRHRKHPNPSPSPQRAVAKPPSAAPLRIAEVHPLPSPLPAQAPHSEPVVDDMVAPLAPDRTGSPHKKRPHPPARDPKDVELVQEWNKLRVSFEQLERKQPCDLSGMKLLCNRYDTLREEVLASAGDPSSQQRLMPRIHSLALAIQQKRAGY